MCLNSGVFLVKTMQQWGRHSLFVCAFCLWNHRILLLTKQLAAYVLQTSRWKTHTHHKCKSLKTYARRCCGYVSAVLAARIRVNVRVCYSTFTTEILGLSTCTIIIHSFTNKVCPVKSNVQLGANLWASSARHYKNHTACDQLMNNNVFCIERIWPKFITSLYGFVVAAAAATYFDVDILKETKSLTTNSQSMDLKFRIKFSIATCEIAGSIVRRNSCSATNFTSNKATIDKNLHALFNSGN